MALSSLAVSVESVYRGACLAAGLAARETKINS